MPILDKYSTSKIRHPSWRVYKAIADINERFPLRKETLDELKLENLGLKEDIDVYIPYKVNDPLTEALIRIFTEEDYDDQDFNIKDSLSLFLDVPGRQLLECGIMTGQAPLDLANDIGYSSELAMVYSRLFFDVSVWRTPADRDNYIFKGICGKDSQVKTTVLKRGYEYAKAKIFNVQSKVKLDRALADIFAKAYEKTMTLMDTSCSPEDDKVAQEWIKVVLATFKELKNANQAEGGIRELTIALQSAPAPKTSIEDLTGSNE